MVNIKVWNLVDRPVTVKDGGKPNIIENKVLKLERALYGLKISSIQWNKLFIEVAENIGFQTNDSDHCLFIYKRGNTIIILLIYVDDILLAGNNEMKMREIIILLKSKFQMRELGEPREFLGIKIN